MKKNVKRIIAVALIFCMFSSTISALADSEYISGGGGTGGTVGSIDQGDGSDEIVWWDSVGFKVTTYVLATESVGYMMELYPQLKSYIVHSRPDMQVLLGKSVKDEATHFDIDQVNQILNRYAENASYTSEDSEFYLADYYQQLGRPFVVQTTGTRAKGMPGFMLSTTSPDYHLSQYSELYPDFVDRLDESDTYMNYAEFDSSKLSNVISKFRTEFEISKLSRMNESTTDANNTRLTFGNYYNANPDWNNKYNEGELKLFNLANLSSMIGNIKKVNDLMTSQEFLDLAIKGAIVSGIYEDGLCFKDFDDLGIKYEFTSQSGNAPTDSNAIFQVISCVTDGENSTFTEAEASIQCKYNGNPFGIKIANGNNLYDVFLNKYSCNGINYKMSDFELSGNGQNYGLQKTVVFVVEPLTCDYVRQDVYVKNKHSDKDYKELWGKYWEYVKNDKPIDNGFFFSLRDRMYWFSGLRVSSIKKGLEAYKGSKGFVNEDAGFTDQSQKTLPKSTRPDEKYNVGLVLNNIPAGGLSFHQTVSANAGMRLMNVAMVNNDTYAEVNRTELSDENRYVENHLSGYYGISDKIQVNGSKEMPPGVKLWNTSTNSLSDAVHGGLVINYYVVKNDNKSARILDPFPAVAVRHISETAIEENNGSMNVKDGDSVLMRDTNTWTVPVSLGLAIQHDLALANFIVETQTVGMALGYANNSKLPKNLTQATWESHWSDVFNDMSEYEIAKKYAWRVVKQDSSVLLRFGNYDLKSERNEMIEKLANQLCSQEFEYNGIKVKSIPLKQLLSYIFNLGDTSTWILASDNGESQEQVDIYKQLQNAIIDYYSQFDIQVPLVPSKALDGKEIELDDNKFWAVPAKPVTVGSGSLEYTDGEVTRKKIEGAEDSGFDLQEKIDEYNTGNWDYIKDLKTADNEDTKAKSAEKLGSTYKLTENVIKYPLYRIFSPMEYYKQSSGLWHSNVVMDSYKSKSTFYYGTNIRTGLENSEGKEYTLQSYYNENIKGVKTGLPISSLINLGKSKSNGKVISTYIPTGKIYAEYIDTLMDITLFSGGLVNLDKDIEKETQRLNYFNATDVIGRSSKFKNTMWQYLIDGKNSTLIKALQGNKSASWMLDKTHVKKFVDNILSVNGVSTNYDVSNYNSLASFDVISKAVSSYDFDMSAYWLNPKWMSSLEISYKSNMLFDADISKDNTGRSFNTVWVPDLASQEYEYAEGQYETEGTEPSDSQTVMKEMFTNYDETITSIAVAYNPVMSVLEGWTYRQTERGSASEEESKVIECALGEYDLPDKYSVTMIEEVEDDLSDIQKSVKLRGQGIDLLKLPNEIPSYNELNSNGSYKDKTKVSLEVGTINRNMIEYTEKDGWNPAQWGYFEKCLMSAEEMVEENCKASYVVETTGEHTNTNTGYITLNVGSMLQYGDLGTFDVYYTQDVKSGILDLVLDVETPTSAVPTWEEIVNGSRPVQDSMVSKFRELPKPYAYTFKTTKDSKEYGVEDKDKYMLTAMVYAKESTGEVLGLSGLDLLNVIINPGEDYTVTLYETDSVALKEIMESISPSDSVYFINVWLRQTVTEDESIDEGDLESIAKAKGYIRSDELVSAQLMMIAEDSSIVKAVATYNKSCGYSYRGCRISSITWTLIKACYKKEGKSLTDVVANNSKSHSDAFTILGTGNTDKTYRMRFLGDDADSSLTSSVTYRDYLNGKTRFSNFEKALTKITSGTFDRATATVSLPSQNSYEVFLTHRSMSGDSTGYVKSPALAGYMQGTESNTKYQKFMDEVGIDTVNAYDMGDVISNSSNRVGYESTSLLHNLLFRNLTSSFGFNASELAVTQTKYNVRYSGCTWYTRHSYWSNGRYHTYSVKHTHSPHTKVVSNSDVSFSLTTTDNEKKIQVEGAYLGTNTVQSQFAKDMTPKVTVFDNYLQSYQPGVAYYVPNQIKFNPAFIMRADYNENAFETGNKYSAMNSVGNRQPVWVLGGKERTLNVYDYHEIALVSGGSTIVSGAWSTDIDDVRVAKDTKVPTIKSGGAIKPLASNSVYKITSVIYLKDPNFVSSANRSQVIAENETKLKEHNNLVDRLLGMGNNDRASNNYSLLYSNIPGSFDKGLVDRGILEFKTEFVNTVFGRKNYFRDSETVRSLEQTQLKIKDSQASVIHQNITGVYLNKNYTGYSEYTDNDYSNSRSYTVKIPEVGNANAVNKTISLEVQNVGSLSSSVIELDNARYNNLTEFGHILESGIGDNSWYKEEYEGIIEVKIETSVAVSVEGDYSIIWSNLSDWTDSSPVLEYTNARPIESLNMSGISYTTGLNPGARPNLLPDNTGIGYGLFAKDITLGGVNYGDLSLLWAPYIFHIKGSIYDETVN